MAVEIAAQAAGSAAEAAKEGGKEGAKVAGEKAAQSAAQSASAAGASGSGVNPSASSAAATGNNPQGRAAAPQEQDKQTDKLDKAKIGSDLANGLSDAATGSDDWEVDKNNAIGKTTGGIAGGIVGGIIGQILIPVPVIGGGIGGSIGGAIGEAIGDITEFFIKVFVIFIVLFALIIGGVWIQKGTDGSLMNNQTTRYSQDPLGDNKTAKDSKIFKGGDDTLDEFDFDYPLQKGLDTYVDGIEGEPDTGLKDAMGKAIANKCMGMIFALGDSKVSKVRAWTFFSDMWAKVKSFWTNVQREKKGYNLEKSLETFYENPWPYDKGDAKIGDYIASIASDSYVNSSKALKKYRRDFVPKYDDVNWIEILSVFSMNTKYDWNNINYDEFNEYIHSDENQFKYFEMGVKWAAKYSGSVSHPDEDCPYCTKTQEVKYDTEDELADYLKANPSIKTTCRHGYEIIMVPQYYYCNIKVKPFGLRELYDLAQVSPDDKYQVTKNGRSDDKDGVSFFYHTNEDMLDYNELWTRTYLRKFDKRGRFSVGGPAYDVERSKQSTIYNDLGKCKDKHQPKKYIRNTDGYPYLEETNIPTGRSDWYYIKKVQTFEDNIIDPKAVFDIRQPDVVDPHVDQMLEGIDNLNEEQKDLIAKVLTYVYAAEGCPYSQAQRMNEGIYDCSSLVWRAYDWAGLNCGDTTWALTTVGWVNWGKEHGCLVEGGEFINIPGTILIAEPGNIHHAMISLGDGYIMHAKGVNWGVVKEHYTKRSDLSNGRYYAIYPWMVL